jgi:hypothetical protein
VTSVKLPGTLVKYGLNFTVCLRGVFACVCVCMLRWCVYGCVAAGAITR